MARIGYARVSSMDQDYGVQEARLKAARCDVIRAEKASGKSRDGRDELATIMDFIRPGDDLVVVKLDRLGRSTRDVLNLVHELESKGAALTVLEPAFSTRDATGPVLVTVLGMVAEMERKFGRVTRMCRRVCVSGAVLLPSGETHARALRACDMRLSGVFGPFSVADLLALVVGIIAVRWSRDEPTRA